MNRRNGMLGALGAAILALGLTTSPVRAQGTSQRQCTTVDLAMMTITNDCNGDVVTLTSGTMTTCAEAVFDASGGKHAVVQVQGLGFGVGSSGVRYVFHINAVASIELPSSTTDVVTAVAPAALIAQGSATNEVVDVLLHVTVDPNGNPTAMVDNTTVRCQG